MIACEENRSPAAYSCSDCPRGCMAWRDPAGGSGLCGAGIYPSVAKTMTHHWEEPCISGTDGAGNLFFAGCNLHCVYCQNARISDRNAPGRYPIFSVPELRSLFLSVAAQKVHNLNLITGSHYSRMIAEALDPDTKQKIGKPVIFNCGGYEKEETLSLLDGKIDVFLPDLKYLSPAVSEKYSCAPDYPDVARKAILKMVEMTGPCRYDENGLLQKGVLIRHLILPGNLPNTLAVIDWVNETFAPGEIAFSLMSQYTPCPDAGIRDFPELQRRLTRYEKKKAEAYLLSTDNITDAYVQEDGADSPDYIPDF